MKESAAHGLRGLAYVKSSCSGGGRRARSAREITGVRSRLTSVLQERHL